MVRKEIGHFHPYSSAFLRCEYVIEASEVVDLDGSVSTGLYRSTFRTGSSATGFELTGQVRDAAGIPIEGAAVTLEGRGNSTTDDVGRFSFTGLNVGNHTLEVRCDGFAATAIPVEIADQDAFVDLTMERLPQPLTSATVRHAIHDLELPIALVISAALLFGLVTTGRADRGVDIIGQRLERLAQALQRLRRDLERREAGVPPACSRPNALIPRPHRSGIWASEDSCIFSPGLSVARVRRRINAFTRLRSNG